MFMDCCDDPLFPSRDPPICFDSFAFLDSHWNLEGRRFAGRNDWQEKKECRATTARTEGMRTFDLNREERERTRCEVKTKLYSLSLSFMCLHQSLTLCLQFVTPSAGPVQWLYQAMKGPGVQKGPPSGLYWPHPNHRWKKFWQENISVLSLRFNVPETRGFLGTWEHLEVVKNAQKSYLWLNEWEMMKWHRRKEVTSIARAWSHRRIVWYGVSMSTRKLSLF